MKFVKVSCYLFQKIKTLGLDTKDALDYSFEGGECIKIFKEKFGEG